MSDDDEVVEKACDFFFDMVEVRDETSMTPEPHCLCEQCKMTVQQCKERTTSAEQVLIKLHEWSNCHLEEVEDEEGELSDVIPHGELLAKIADMAIELRSQRGREPG